MVVHHLFKHKTLGRIFFRQRAVPSQPVYLSFVVSFHGKLNMLKTYVNSGARGTNFLIENKGGSSIFGIVSETTVGFENPVSSPIFGREWRGRACKAQKTEHVSKCTG